MGIWDRFDIAEAHAVLEWDFNIGGWLRERPSNRRRNESTSTQLMRLKFKPRANLAFSTLSENGKVIYLEQALKLGLPLDDELKVFCTEMQLGT